MIVSQTEATMHHEMLIMSTRVVSKSAEDTIEELKRRFRAKTDRELAGFLRVDASAISMWRKRNSVPAKYVAQARHIEGHAPEFAETYLAELFLELMERNKAIIAFGNERSTRLWWARKLIQYQSRMEYLIEPLSTHDERIAFAEQLRDYLSTTDALEFLDTLPLFKGP